MVRLLLESDLEEIIDRDLGSLNERLVWMLIPRMACVDIATMIDAVAKAKQV